jgi:DNA (cytosine-5)-methyltransferase 1
MPRVKHFYNEHNAYRAAVLRERMEEGLLPQGIVDERNVEEIPDADFLGWTQIHLFAGIGGFPLGLRLAGFPEDRRIVTGGFPCQDISNAGKRAGITGSRSGLWREMVRCIRVVRPELVFVENVAALLCRGMGEVLGDLAEIGYDAEGDCVSAADVGAPHLRRRIWIVAYAVGSGVRDESIAERWRDGASVVEHAGEVSDDAGQRTRRLSVRPRRQEETAPDSEWSGPPVANAERPERWTLAERRHEPNRNGAGRKEAASGTRTSRDDVQDTAETRLERPDLGEVGESGEGRSDAITSRSGRWPVEPDVGRVAHGIPRRVDRLAALGDAIVPQCVAEVVKKMKL